MAVAQDKPSSAAITSLVLGILSFVLCGLFSAIPAWIMGKNEIARIQAGQSPEAGRTLATVGMWLGIIATVLSIIGLVVFFLMGGLALIGMSAAGGGGAAPQ
jgi:hypothetical protein